MGFVKWSNANNVNSAPAGRWEVRTLARGVILIGIETLRQDDITIMCIRTKKNTRSLLYRKMLIYPLK